MKLRDWIYERLGNNRNLDYPWTYDYVMFEKELNGLSNYQFLDLISWDIDNLLEGMEARMEDKIKEIAQELIRNYDFTRWGGVNPQALQETP